MNKKLFALSILILVIVVSYSCKKESNKKVTTEKLKVGLVFDVGGRGDKSFNDAAYSGLDSAKKVLGIEYELVEPMGVSDREAALRNLTTKKDVALIFGVGFMFTDDITKLALEFPEKKFACIDYTITPDTKIPDNLSAIRFNEEEGSFLVGAIAGLVTKTNIVGFLGGMESPLIKKFETGFEKGVHYVNPECKVLKAYVSATDEGFANVGKGKEIALTLYGNGADIIYHAAGRSGVGLFDAARQLKKLAIGVDQDQYNEAPGFVLTSMTKQVKEAVFNTIKNMLDGKFIGGIKTFGLKENGVDYVYNDLNKNLISEEVRRKVEQIREKIIRNEISILNKN
ncbi:MAG: BMP family lipoprotein [Ignavibacteria bacterium]